MSEARGMEEDKRKERRNGEKKQRKEKRTSKQIKEGWRQEWVHPGRRVRETEQTKKKRPLLSAHRWAPPFIHPRVFRFSSTNLSQYDDQWLQTDVLRAPLSCGIPDKTALPPKAKI